MNSVLNSILLAVIDRIIPGDQDPGALDLETDRFVITQLQQTEPAAIAVSTGLKDLDEVATAKFGTRFAALTTEQQDDLLKSIEHEDWFVTLAELTAEGFYADPGNGGNREALSWRMIGYEHRLPDGPNGPQPLHLGATHDV